MERRQLLRLAVGIAVTVPALALLSQYERLGLARRLHERIAPKSAEHAGADDFVPRTLDRHRYATVSRIADLILPQTDSPGALAVKVPQFIDLLLTESFLPDDRDVLIAGLAAIDARSQAAHGFVFARLSEAQQQALLTALDIAGTPAGRRLEQGTAEHGFAQLKKMALYGYFTSELVMRELMHFEIVPGHHQECVPMGERA